MNLKYLMFSKNVNTRKYILHLCYNWPSTGKATSRIQTYLPNQKRRQGTNEHKIKTIVGGYMGVVSL